MLVVQDKFTGFTLGIPHHQDDDSNEMARLLERYVYYIFGLPRVVMSDHDARFASEFFRDTHKRMGVSVELGTPYHYQTLGGVENHIKTL